MYVQAHFDTLPISFDGTVGTVSGISLLLYAAADYDFTSGDTVVPTGALPPFLAGCLKRPTYVWTTALRN